MEKINIFGFGYKKADVYTKNDNEIDDSFIGKVFFDAEYFFKVFELYKMPGMGGYLDGVSKYVNKENEHFIKGINKMLINENGVFDLLQHGYFNEKKARKYFDKIVETVKQITGDSSYNPEFRFDSKSGFQRFKDSYNYEQDKIDEEKQRQAQEPIRCPKCGSTQITADKKGFGIGKAIAGDLVAGAVGGLVAGSMGKDKVIITCLNCGHKWKAGKRK